MAHSGNILLGKITKIHGFEGAVTVKLEKNFSENIPGMESVFIEIDGRPVPFFIDYIEHVNADKAYIMFVDYNSIEKIREFVGCRILVPEKHLNSDQGNEQDDLNGYIIYSEVGQLIGEVVETIKNPAQWLLKIKSSAGKEILVPLHEDLIAELDEKNKVIRMMIPEGLTEINTIHPG